MTVPQRLLDSILQEVEYADNQHPLLDTPFASAVQIHHFSVLLNECLSKTYHDQDKVETAQAMLRLICVCIRATRDMDLLCQKEPT